MTLKVLRHWSGQKEKNKHDHITERFLNVRADNIEFLRSSIFKNVARVFCEITILVLYPSYHVAFVTLFLNTFLDVCEHMNKLVSKNRCIYALD